MLPPLDAEWLESDAMGGFASGTVGLARSRRYHALLLVPQHPPTDRVVLVNGGVDTFDFDATWKDEVTFHEYFHGDTGKGLGASHQTGWTGLVAKLLDEKAGGTFLFTVSEP